MTTSHDPKHPSIEEQLEWFEKYAHAVKQFSDGQKKHAEKNRLQHESRPVTPLHDHHASQSQTNRSLTLAKLPKTPNNDNDSHSPKSPKM